MHSAFFKGSFKDIVIIIFSTLLLTLLVWLPHFTKTNFYSLDFSTGFASIYRNFDGIEYIVIAKSFYQPTLIGKLPQSLPAIYYSSHFPGFSLLILTFAPILGYLKSMLFVSILFTILSAITFYFLAKNFKVTEHPLILSLVFLILPARWLVVHSVGSAEPLFICLTLLTFYFFLKFESTLKISFILLTAIFGFLAQLTRPPGILIFFALGIYILWKVAAKKISLFESIKLYYPILIIPLCLVLIFGWYSFSYQDFFAYFHSGDNLHLIFPPFQVFNKSQFWVGSIWLEDVVYIFALGFMAAFTLIKKKLYPLATFVFVYLVASIFIAHRDISRYTLPIAPFAILAFEKILTSKEFKIVSLIIILAIYLYAQNFLLGNTGPYANLEYFN